MMLTDTQLAILLVFNRVRRPSMREVAKEVMLSSTAVHFAVNRLVDEGYLVKIGTKGQSRCYDISGAGVMACGQLPLPLEDTEKIDNENATKSTPALGGGDTAAAPGPAPADRSASATGSPPVVVGLGSLGHTNP